jgi:hypothetical protein
MGLEVVETILFDQKKKKLQKQGQLQKMKTILQVLSNEEMKTIASF